MKQKRANQASKRASGSARLSEEELLEFLKNCLGEAVNLVLGLRDVVLAEVPDVMKTTRFRGLCYFKPDMRYGCIGGHECGILTKDGAVALNFLQGAFLPDPSKLLTGSGKVVRRVAI